MSHAPQPIPLEPVPPERLASTSAAAVAGSFGAAVRAGAGLAWNRLWRKAGWLTAALAVVAAATIGAIEHRALAFGAPDRAVGALVALIMPLSCFALLRIGIGTRRLADAAWRVSRWGLERAWVVLGMLLAIGVAAALVSATAVAASLLFAHAGAAALGPDLLTSSWIAALGAATYVAFYGAGATFLAAGRGRWVALGLDFALGAGQGAAAVLWPRSHLANLVGEVPVLGWEQPWSVWALAALAVFWTAVTCARCRG